MKEENKTKDKIQVKKEKHSDFVRVCWDDACALMVSALHDKYRAKGIVTLKKDYGYDGIGDFYDSPTFVDVELKEK